MAMQGWITHDDEGREVLVRSGRGKVTAIATAVASNGATAVASKPTADRGAGYVVEIECDIPSRARAVRYTTRGVVAGDSPLVAAAMDAEASGAPVDWAIEWRRHAWVPGHLPVDCLDLATDAQATLLSLVPAAEPAVPSAGASAGQSAGEPAGELAGEPGGELTEPDALPRRP